MPRIAYLDKKFRPATLEIIAHADRICAEYRAQGLDLTLRQLYYQFVAQGLIVNKQTEYDRLGAIVNDARLAGLLDWNYIVDRGREVEGAYGGFEDPSEAIAAIPSWYAMDIWKGQRYRVEAWVEKDALSAVLRRAARGTRIPTFACKGYTSQSALWNAAQRIEEYLDTDGVDEVLILHLGDHDPSGIDMTRDIRDRFTTFLWGDGYDSDRVTIKRIALTMDQVQEFNPPPNPAKMTDSRVGGYIARYGYESWELDALTPTYLVDLIDAEVRSLIDPAPMDEHLEQERTDKGVLRGISNHWDEVREWAQDQGYIDAD